MRGGSLSFAFSWRLAWALDPFGAFLAHLCLDIFNCCYSLYAQENPEQPKSQRANHLPMLYPNAITQRLKASEDYSTQTLNGMGAIGGNKTKHAKDSIFKVVTGLKESIQEKLGAKEGAQLDEVRMLVVKGK
eukprot:Gb_15242 [translate_table: standard]